MVDREVVTGKIAVIERCLDRIAEVHGARKADLLPADITLLEKRGVIDPQLAGKLRKMVGFRNIAVHEYETVDPAIVDAIVQHHLGDLRAFSRRILEAFDL